MIDGGRQLRVDTIDCCTLNISLVLCVLGDMDRNVNYLPSQWQNEIKLVMVLIVSIIRTLKCLSLYIPSLSSLASIIRHHLVLFRLIISSNCCTTVNILSSNLSIYYSIVYRASNVIFPSCKFQSFPVNPAESSYSTHSTPICSPSPPFHSSLSSLALPSAL